jgi:predicted O-linked N-acetylglucosamine transferase (SPINDLY family)
MPAQVDALHIKAVACAQRRDLSTALAGLDSVLRLAPTMAEACKNRGWVLYELARYSEAVASCERALALEPGLAEAWYIKGNSLRMLGERAQAVAAYDEAVRRNARHAAGWTNLGCVLHELRRFAEAEQAFQRALRLEPRGATHWLNCANALLAMDRAPEALACCERALSLAPQLSAAWLSAGAALRRLGRLQEAVTSIERSLSGTPNDAAGWNSHGNVLQDLMRLPEALSSYDRAVVLDPRNASIRTHRAGVLLSLYRHEEAIAECTRALSLAPDMLGALQNRGNAYAVQRNPEAARADFARILQLEPDHPFAASMLFKCKAELCDFTDRDRECAELAARSVRVAETPLAVLLATDDPEIQLSAARTYLRYKGLEEQILAPAAARRETPQRLRLAYLSPDFRDHPVGIAIAELFEQHDRTRFELTAVSLRGSDQSSIRRRLESAFDRFLEVGDASDARVAEAITALEIDVLIDLTGLTEGGRPGILARRPAPVQVNYLGYPGSAGGKYHDYLLADRYVIPQGEQPHYTEKIAYVPDCFMVSDSTRLIASETPPRAELGLPEDAFVLCSFNAPHKISPQVFGAWMRLLDRVPESVLWLSVANPAARANLRREALRHGVPGHRLLFAQRIVEADRHLARLRAADLALDTFPYNGHTTTADALWAELPVLTCSGRSFASRVAGSLLHAAGLEQLVTSDLPSYERVAVELATNRAHLRELRQRLARSGVPRPPFDTPRACRSLERAYLTMWERHLHGESPATFGVEGD